MHENQEGKSHSLLFSTFSIFFLLFRFIYSDIEWGRVSSHYTYTHNIIVVQLNNRQLNLHVIYRVFILFTFFFSTILRFFSIFFIQSPVDALRADRKHSIKCFIIIRCSLNFVHSVKL